MSHRVRRPLYRSMVIGPVGAGGETGLGCAVAPGPTEAMPPIDTLIAVITAATGCDRALHNTLMSPPPGTRVARIYPLRTRRARGLPGFLRGVPRFPYC